MSFILDVDFVLARQSQREARNQREGEVAGHTLAALLEYKAALEEVWEGVGWIRDVLSYGRVNENSGGINVATLTEWYINQVLTCYGVYFVINLTDHISL